MKLYILTWCQNEDSFYGNSLIFKTLRVGFPNAEITICDNQSIESASFELEKLSRVNDCKFVRLESEVQHYYFLERVTYDASLVDDEIVFVDPDIVFWGTCEEWEFEGLMAGRLIPKFYDEFSGCITHPRLHTSFLWIPSPKRVFDVVQSLGKFEYSPFKPFMLPLDDSWHRYDTTSSFYSVFKDYVDTFNEDELNRYDHLFCGTHLDLVKDKLTDGEDLSKLHEEAKRDINTMKGIWIDQEKHFEQRSV